MGMSQIHQLFHMCKKYWCIWWGQDPLSLMPLPGIRKVNTSLTFSSVQVQHGMEAEPYACFMQHKLWH